ncbi:3-hydroxyisobutyrate dehydrogenase [Rippkaea orientalis PCC 8801]|uniref:3-hydroxyisobutyrate dehydrogenase n=1 Tax=Rippkaea orientalis (strain PCC 8801 / RF-1) TaxID=41431 RepID=B7K3M8_RIPO1|nr:NAD(P)-dependent oxidoreductase [Rippkaea orientalis]ACK65370.1 3-hydroxyisobutyrate dehydrogenase [Rippkaea orientalis PCC 8801]
MVNNQLQKAAFLGLGLMGSAMSANLARQGFSVKGWNRTSDRPGITIAKEAGVRIVSSLKEAVESADFIFTCVGDVPDVEEVILGEKGVINYAQSGALIVDFSTIGSEAARHIGSKLKAHHLRFLDAPISGGDIGAKQGTLTIMVGGEIADFEACLPYFQAMGKTIRHCGPVGSGQAVKMCNQALCSVHMVALCEAILMAQKQGIDPNLMIEVCSTGAAGSWALSNLGSKIINQEYDPGFAIKHILKDLRLLQQTINNSGEQLPGVELASHLFKLVSEMDNGEGKEQGTQAMIRQYIKEN